MAPFVLPYCGDAPVPVDLLTRWNLDPSLIAALVLGYFLARTIAAGRLATLGAFVVLAILFISPLCALSSALFAMRVTHHVILAGLVAPLAAIALPRSGSRLTAWMLAHAAIFWGWHAPQTYAAALASDTVYWLMQASLLGSAIGFWRAVRSAPVPVGIAALLATMVHMGLLGALLTFADRPFYAWHAVTTQAWGFTPGEDQQLAGLIMWVPGATLYLGAALLLANRWFRAQEAPVRSNSAVARAT